MTMKILGIDPSVRALGWALLHAKNEGENLEYIESDTIYTQPSESMPIRLAKIFKKINSIFEESVPDVVVIESVFVKDDPQAILKLSYVRGMVMMVCGLNSVKVIEVSPTVVKKSVTSNGRAGKDKVRSMLPHLFGLKTIKFSSYDASDALAIAYTGAISSI